MNPIVYIYLDIPFDLTSGTDIGLEHEVELDRSCQLVSGSWVSDVELLDKFTELWSTVVVDLNTSVNAANTQGNIVSFHRGGSRGTDLGKGRLVLCDSRVSQLDSLTLDRLLLFLLLVIPLVNLDLLLDTPSLFITLQPSFEDTFDNVIRTEDFPSLNIFYHPVGKLVDVARGLEDIAEGNACRIEL